MAVIAEDEKLAIWLRLQITRAQDKVDTELQALDRRAAAGRWYTGNGRRIAEAIEVIKATIVPLADEIYKKAPNSAGHAAIHNYFCELNDRAIRIAQSAGAKISPETGKPDATMLAAIQLLDKIRDDLEMQWQIVAPSTEKEGSEIPNDALDAEDIAVERFRNQPRWGLLPVLAWIATLDLRTAYRASSGEKSIDGANISIVLRQTWDNAQIRYKRVEDAFAFELCPSISDGRLAGSGSLVSGAALNHIEQRRVGLTFPPADQPHVTDALELWQRKGHDVGLIPKGSQFAHEWTDWRDLTFPTARVLELWPGQIDPAMSGIAPEPIKIEPDKPVSEAQLNADFNAYLSSQGERLPIRPEVRAWGKSKYGARVTTDRLDDLYMKDAEARPRKRGRRPARIS